VLTIPGRMVELGAVQHEDDVQKFMGRPHDLICFDELVHFTYTQYSTLIAWNRTAFPGQRCRIVSSSNPPIGEESVGVWIVDYWSPWLSPDDPLYPYPEGELLWYCQIEDEFILVEGKDDYRMEGDLKIYPKSRTFISSSVKDNPYYAGTDYERNLANLPHELKRRLYYGDFSVAVEDNPWQVIPTAWARAAQERWSPRS